MNPASHRAALTLAIGGAVAMAAAFGFGRFVYTPILPHMIADGLTPSAAGFVAAANYLGYLAGGFVGITGLMQARARAWFLGGIAISGLTMIAMAFTHDVWAFAVLRFVGGAGGTTVMVAGASLRVRAADGRRRRPLRTLAVPGAGAWHRRVVLRRGAARPGRRRLADDVDRHRRDRISGDAARHGLSATRHGRGRRGRGRASGPCPLVASPCPADPVLRIVRLRLHRHGDVHRRHPRARRRRWPSSNPTSGRSWVCPARRRSSSGPPWCAGSASCRSTWSAASPRRSASRSASSIRAPGGIILAAVFVGGTFVAITAIGLQIGRRLAGGAPQKIQAAMTGVVRHRPGGRPAAGRHVARVERYVPRAFAGRRRRACDRRRFVARAVSAESASLAGAGRPCE